MAEQGEHSAQNILNRIAARKQQMQVQQEEVNRLKVLYEEKCQEVKQAHAEYVELQNKYNNLKVARASIGFSKADAKQAYELLNAMIREIDYCIIQVSENPHGGKRVTDHQHSDSGEALSDSHS